MDISKKLEPILRSLDGTREALREYREIVLANAVMFGEVPAPTFEEEERVRFLSDRFTECGLQNISIDEGGNAMAILPGRTGKKNILLEAHVDTVFGKAVDHSVTVGTDRISGPGIADNSLGLGVISALPILIEKLGLEFDSNIVLLGATRNLGRGDLGGLRFFLDNVKMDLRAGVCVTGMHLGRLSYTSLGMLRGVINCEVPAETDWERSNSSGAIVNINNILSRILEIPTPREPRTSIILGAIIAGNAYNTVPTQASLRFELRSEQDGMVGQVRERIEEIIAEVTAKTLAEAELEVIARRQPGGIAFDHPLVKSTRTIMRALGIKPRIAPSTGSLSALIDKGIPGVTLGISNGGNLHEMDESIEIEPIFSGLTQLIGVLQAIDTGVMDDE